MFWSLSLIVLGGKVEEADDVDFGAGGPALEGLFGAALVAGDTLLKPLYLFVAQAKLESLL